MGQKTIWQWLSGREENSTPDDGNSSEEHWKGFPMSQETAAWLNTKVLIGHVASDSPHSRIPGVEYQAWHNDPTEYADGESNHYPYSIPVADVERRLLDFRIMEAPFQVPVTELTDDGVNSFTLTDPNRKVLYHSETRSPFGVVGSDYSTPDYRSDVVQFANDIVSGADSGLEIMSAGLLRQGARFWIQVCLPTGMQAAGFAFSPWLTITDSCDGLPWRIFKGSTAVVCDNTLSLGINTRVSGAVVRHTLNRRDGMQAAVSAMGVVTDFGKAMSHRLDVLAGTTVTDAQWEKFLDVHYGELPKESGTSRTVQLKNREGLTNLYAGDPMVAPWCGTALGVVQAVNTQARHHVKNVGRAVTVDPMDRHLTRILDGHYADVDKSTINEINTVFKGTRSKQLAFA
jgi:phage/plasmid-like protein (TIGR03299 family)